MPEHTSNPIVIVGGGIVGCATAYALSKRTTAKIVVLEQDTSYRQCSTTRSAGGIRQQFSTPENIYLSQVTVALLKNLATEFSPDANLSFREHGYLLLATQIGLPIIAENVAVQNAHGAQTTLLLPDALRQNFPWLDTTNIAGGSFGPTGEGWIDPSAFLNLLRQGIRQRGIIIQQARVREFARTNNHIDSVILDNGDRISGAIFVNAAGAWSGELAQSASIHLPVEPRKRFVYVADTRDASDALHAAPLIVDASGVWFRPEGTKFICGVSPTETEEPPAVDLDIIDETPFNDRVWPALAARVPAFQSMKLINTWAGYYDYNTFDQNALIGQQGEIDNFFVASGFSGHGLQQAYAAGRALSELIIDGKFTTIDLSRFSPNRVAANTPIFEKNII
ncbi:MAG: FAD-binding oxidoreductase [Hyphomicrobiaceae bacterium]